LLNGNVYAIECLYFFHLYLLLLIGFYLIDKHWSYWFNNCQRCLWFQIWNSRWWSELDFADI
jgi:hypothetical protein